MNYDYEHFSDTVTEQLEGSLPPGFHLERRSVTKLNGMVLDGIFLAQEGQEYARTLYLNDLYQMYLDGMSVGEIIDIVLNMGTHELKEEEQVFMNVTDLDTVRDRICMRLVNEELNREALKEWAHVKFLDLAAVFYILIDSDDGYYQTAVLNSLLEKWGVSKSELIRLACANTKKINPPELMSIESLLAQMGFGTGTDAEHPELMSLGSKTRRNGAIYMMDTQILSRCAEDMNDDLLIVPSSIHEVIIAPRSCIRREDADRMIREVNASVLMPGEILSDHAYFYDREERTVTM